MPPTNSQAILMAPSYRSAVRVELGQHPAFHLVIFAKLEFVFHGRIRWVDAHRVGRKFADRGPGERTCLRLKCGGLFWIGGALDSEVVPELAPTANGHVNRQVIASERNDLGGTRSAVDRRTEGAVAEAGFVLGGGTLVRPPF